MLHCSKYLGLAPSCFLWISAMVDSDSPKDKVQPVVQVGRDKGAFQCSPVHGYEVLGAIGPGWQLYCIHRLAVLAEPQWQPLIVNQETAHTHTHTHAHDNSDVDNTDEPLGWQIRLSISHVCRSALCSQKYKDSQPCMQVGLFVFTETQGFTQWQYGEPAMTGFEESVSAVTCTHSRV